MSYLNLLEAQLVNASRELSAANGSGARERSRLGAIAARHTKLRIGLAVLALTVASGAIADAAGVLTLPAFWQQNPAAPSPYGMATSIPGPLASAFSILRASRQPAGDSLPAAGQAAMSVKTGIGEHYGVNPALSRYAGTVDGMPVWLVPGNTGGCMYTASDGSWCTSTQQLSTQGVLGLLIPVAPGPDTFIGIVPDGATVTATNNDGTTFAVPLNVTAYTVSGDPNLRSVTIHEADGQQDTNNVPITRPPAPVGAPAHAANGE